MRNRVFLENGMFLQFNMVLCNASYYINRVVRKENEWGDDRGVVAIMGFVVCELGNLWLFPKTAHSKREKDRI